MTKPYRELPYALAELRGTLMEYDQMPCKSLLERLLRAVRGVARGRWVSEDAYELAEQENANLRATLEWLLELGRRLNAPPDAGGVTDEHRGFGASYQETADLAALCGRAADHLIYGQVAGATAPSPVWDKWTYTAEQIAHALRSHEPPGKPIVLTAREMAERAAKSDARRVKP